MAESSLVVFICGHRAGLINQDTKGSLSFRYESEYNGVPLSLSMPVSNRTFSHKTVLPFLYGLLPDDRSVRRSMGREFGVGSDNPFLLLTHIGLDCPGAVQFCQPDKVDNLAKRLEELMPIDEATIGNRLVALRERREDSWLGSQEHWSLGGNQGKFALARKGDTWFECHGAAPTTHIFKNGVQGFRLQALNEFVCMRLAARVGLPVAAVQYESFDGEPAIIIERYDRATTSNGTTVRLHQEDFCQILGVLPENKYSEYGGPSAADILRVLASAPQAPRNIKLFTTMLFFNSLIGAPDAHAKNYSLLHGGEGNVLLAPLYDVASGLAYEELRRKARLAMSVGGENRIGHISRNNLQRYSEANNLGRFGLGKTECIELMTGLARAILSNLADAFDDAREAEGVNELRNRLESPITQLCETELRLLEAQG